MCVELSVWVIDFVHITGTAHSAVGEASNGENDLYSIGSASKLSHIYTHKNRMKVSPFGSLKTSL